MPNQKQTSQSQTEINSTTSEIDLNQLTLQELMDLRDRVTAKLASAYLCRMSKYDITIEYEIKARTIDSVVHESGGLIQLPAILNPNLLPNATSKLELAVTNNIMEPLAADLYTVFNNVNAEAPNVLGVTQQPGQIPAPV